VGLSNLKGNKFSKFKLKKKLQINPINKYHQKSEKNNDDHHFTPKSRDVKKNTSLDYKTNPKKLLIKQTSKKLENKLFSSGLNSRWKKKNISVLSRKKSKSEFNILDGKLQLISKPRLKDTSLKNPNHFEKSKVSSFNQINLKSNRVELFFILF
jgi:hypothetical protein